MKKILGYCDRWTVHKGDWLSIKVSLLEGSEYDADVVRVICGVDLPDAPPIDLRPVPTPISGRHQGERQTNPVGSAVAVDMAKLPADHRIGGVRLNIWPTLLKPEKQAILSWYDSKSENGLLLALESDGHVSVDLNGSCLRSAQPIALHDWTSIEFVLEKGSAELRLTPLYASGKPTCVRMSSGGFAPPLTTQLMIAAVADPEGGRWTTAHYNGKIEQPVLLDDTGHILAAWDFTRDHDSPDVADKGPFALHGQTINLPSRATMGSNWTGDIHDWRFAPDQYGAIHFHDDDLYDAAWQTSLSFQIPQDLECGYYTVRLTAGGDESWLPFFVTPEIGKPKAKLAVIASTFTSIAYANMSFHMRVPQEEVTLGRLPVLSAEDVFLRQTPWLGLSHYDTHTDGSGVRYSSRLRPVVNMAPFGEAWNLNADTMLYAWLHHLGQPFDIITDDDLHDHGVDALRQYQCVIAGSHPEYYSTAMRSGLEDYLGQGGRLMYLGGNGFYWRVAASPRFPGALELRRAASGGRYWAEEPGEYHMAFGGELGGLWRHCGKPPQSLVGVGMRAIGFDGIGHFDMQHDAANPRAAFLMAGLTGVVRFGERGALGSAAGEELDAVDAALGTPAHVLIVASSAGHTQTMQLIPEDIKMPHAAMSGAYNADVRADIVFFETVSGGAVFSTGSMTWTASLYENGYDNPVARMTQNALQRFLSPETFNFPGDLN